MIEIVHELRKASGSNAKLKILQAESNNELWQQVLLMMYDTSINYYVSGTTDLTFVDDADYAQMIQELFPLMNRTYTGKAAREYATYMSQEYGEIFRLILGRSLKAGVSFKTINKAYQNLIPMFEVMLAENAEVTKFPVMVSTKYDGVRLIAKVEDGKAELLTRSGKRLYLTDLEEQMAQVADGIYDGELVKGNGLQNDRTGITGSVNKILLGTSHSIDDYCYVIFDCLSLDDWNNKDCSIPYSERLHTLNAQIVDGISIRKIEHEEFNSVDEINELYRAKLDAGYEGLMLRYPEDPYNWVRSTLLIKKKATKTCVLTCTGINEGRGSREGLIGSLKCEGIVDGLEVKVKVGSGLSKFDVAQDPLEFINSKIEVLYNDVVIAENASVHSLFLPRFKRIKERIDV